MSALLAWALMLTQLCRRSRGDLGYAHASAYTHIHSSASHFSHSSSFLCLLHLYLYWFIVHITMWPSWFHSTSCQTVAKVAEPTHTKNTHMHWLCVSLTLHYLKEMDFQKMYTGLYYEYNGSLKVNAQFWVLWFWLIGRFCIFCSSVQFISDVFLNVIENDFACPKNKTSKQTLCT